MGPVLIPSEAGTIFIEGKGGPPISTRGGRFRVTISPMQPCRMCGLELDTIKALHDHTTKTHDLTPSEVDEALNAGAAKTAEEIARAWERHAEALGARIPKIGHQAAASDPSDARDDVTAAAERARRGMRPGGYL